jgi:hypothetical protein
MPFGAMVAQIVGANEACQPAVSLFLGCRLMEMVERFVRVLYRTERTLDFTLARAVVRLPSLPAGMYAITSTPRLSITRLNTADFATGPLSR